MRAPIIDLSLFWPVAYLRTVPTPPLRHRLGREERRERQIRKLIAKSSHDLEICARFPPWIELVTSLKQNQWMGREGSKVDTKQIYWDWAWDLFWSEQIKRTLCLFFSLFTLPFYRPKYLDDNISKIPPHSRISEEQRELIFNQFIICWQSLCIPRKKCKNILPIFHIYLRGLKTRRSKLVWWTRCREVLVWPGERSKSGDHSGGLVS